MNVAVVFPGQGSQFVGMADPWLADRAGSRTLDEASGVLGADVVEGCRDERALATTEFVQPALLACDVAAFRALVGAGATFSGAAGHSLGEFAALVAGEVLPYPVALELVRERGRAMQRAALERRGTMTALLGVGPDAAAELCDEARGDDVLVVANENSPQQVVVSGSVAAVERLEAVAKDLRIRAVRLPVAGAFHSPLMEPAVEALRKAIRAAAFAAPRLPVASNVTGTIVEDPEQLRELLIRHVVSPVRWAACMGSLAGAGADTFVEAGPGDVLTRLAKRVAPTATAVAVGSPDAAATFTAAR
jgi:[acyl-carrier-protein] S-malonyltransferase